MCKEPPLGVRSLVVATRREGLRQRRDLFPVACRLSEGSELVFVSAEGMGRRWREGRPAMYSGPSSFRGQSPGPGLLPFLQPTTEFGALHTVGA